MDKILIITNQIKDKDLSCAKRVEEFLAKQGVAYRTHIYSGKCFLAPKQEDAAWADAVVVIGGDGTMINAAMDLRETGKPILGVNLGNVGYLAEIEPEDLEEALKNMLLGNLKEEKRMMITGSSGDVKYDALNEVTITRNGRLQVLTFKVLVNGMELGVFKADGIIVATPTGSTAYNLSAGGPIVEPTARLMVLTPVCSHSIQCAPMVLSPEDVIEIVITGSSDPGCTVEAVFDCKNSITLRGGDSVCVTSSEKSVTLLKTGRESFLKTLQNKLATS